MAKPRTFLPSGHPDQLRILSDRSTFQHSVSGIDSISAVSLGRALGRDGLPGGTGAQVHLLLHRQEMTSCRYFLGGGLRSGREARPRSVLGERPGGAGLGRQGGDGCVLK